MPSGVDGGVMLLAAVTSLMSAIEGMLGIKGIDRELGRLDTSRKGNVQSGMEVRSQPCMDVWVFTICR